MPFKSKAQQRWMFANKPEMAKEWASETRNLKRLPEKASSSKASRSSRPQRQRSK